MGKMLNRSRGGFTLVELLVVIVIIGMLAGLLVPAVIGARSSARQAECMNNQKQLAQAALQYETARGHFPGYLNPCPGSASSNTWVTVLLPHLGRQDLWREWRDGVTPQHARLVRLDELVCPDDDSQDQFDAPLSYVANCGLWDGYDPEELQEVGSGLRFGDGQNPPDPRCNGVFFNRTLTGSNEGPVVELSASDIADGAAQTLMISETLHGEQVVADDVRLRQQWFDSMDYALFGKDWNYDWTRRAEGRLGFMWMVADDLTELQKMTITRGVPEQEVPETATEDHPQPGNLASNHSGGVVVTFCDGHGKFVRDDIAYRVYQHLMTPDSQEARQRICDARDDQNDPNLSGTLNAKDY